MIDDALVLRVERLRDEVDLLRTNIRQRYGDKRRPVVARDIRDQAAQLGERWVVEIAPREDVRQVIGKELVGDLSIEFQRLITYSEQLSQRARYEAAIGSILRDFRTRIVVPLKQARYKAVSTHASTASPRPAEALLPTSVFVGQSFAGADADVNSAVFGLLEAWGLKVLTGEKPKADTVSKKVRERIESSAIFVGIFTRRERIRSRREWTTSSWVIDEKAYALAKGKTLVLLRENGVQSIGGIQGDYEYIEFTRDSLVDLVIKLLHTLRSINIATQ